MGVLTTPDFWSGQDRTLTVEDMENMPDDEFRCELDDGVLVVSPAPSNLYQRGNPPDCSPKLRLPGQVRGPSWLYDRNRKKDSYEG
jgi:hypothetical protein